MNMSTEIKACIDEYNVQKNALVAYAESLLQNPELFKIIHHDLYIVNNLEYNNKSKLVELFNNRLVSEYWYKLFLLLNVRKKIGIDAEYTQLWDEYSIKSKRNVCPPSFDEETINKFIESKLTNSVELLKMNVNSFLWYCGDNIKVYKKSHTCSNVISYGDNMNDLFRNGLLLLIEYVAYKTNTVYDKVQMFDKLVDVAKIPHNTQIELFKGITFLIKPNKKGTLKLSQEIVDILNESL